MKLPVQAPAVVRGSVSWPTRRPAHGSTEPAIEPADANPVIKCPGASACVCDNGVAVCCNPNTYKQCSTETGICECKT
jgi:hypothetical protein